MEVELARSATRHEFFGTAFDFRFMNGGTRVDQNHT
jgi:hypothetical protein